MKKIIITLVCVVVTGSIFAADDPAPVKEPAGAGLSKADAAGVGAGTAHFKVHLEPTKISELSGGQVYSISTGISVDDCYHCFDASRGYVVGTDAQIAALSQVPTTPSQIEAAKSAVLECRFFIRQDDLCYQLELELGESGYQWKGREVYDGFHKFAVAWDHDNGLLCLIKKTIVATGSYEQGDSEFSCEKLTVLADGYTVNTPHADECHVVRSLADAVVVPITEQMAQVGIAMGMLVVGAASATDSASGSSAS